jgi:hypothetical protein
MKNTRCQFSQFVIFCFFWFPPAVILEQKGMALTGRLGTSRQQACLPTSRQQEVRYSHDITILLQPCVISLVTFLLYRYMIVSDLLEQPCNKSDNAIKLDTSC